MSALTNNCRRIVTLALLVSGLMLGSCASTPVDDRPVVHIFRQMILVPYVAPVEECCWYEPPADEDYGPI